MPLVVRVAGLEELHRRAQGAEAAGGLLGVRAPTVDVDEADAEPVQRQAAGARNRLHQPGAVPTRRRSSLSEPAVPFQAVSRRRSRRGSSGLRPTTRVDRWRSRVWRVSRSPAHAPDPSDTPHAGLGTNLAQFDGGSSLGVWTLCVADSAGGDTGTLTAWTISFTPDVPVELQSLSVE